MYNDDWGLDCFKNKILFETDYRLQPRANEIAPSVGGAMLSGRFTVIYRGMAK